LRTEAFEHGTITFELCTKGFELGTITFELCTEAFELSTGIKFQPLLAAAEKTVSIAFNFQIFIRGVAELYENKIIFER
jgi:hypothetical protein